MATGHALDLTKTHKKRVLGDITVWFTWFGEDPRESEPCMVLTPTMRTGVGRSSPGVVLLSNLWKYNESPKFLLQTAMRFTQAMGMTDDIRNVHKVADIIYDHLDDLAMMPERPNEDRFVAADAVLTGEDGRSQEFEILDHK